MNSNGTDGDEFLQRCAPGCSAGEIHKVENQAIVLAIEMAVDHAGTFHIHGQFVAESPANEVRQQIAVVG